MESDLEPVRFATFAELYPYCYRVASAVGLACVRVWGLRPGATFAEADVPTEAAGIAFQLTNILRDLGEDYARGRVYLPVDELESAGCQPQTWREPQSAACLQEMIHFQVERAREFYRRAERCGLFSAEGRNLSRHVRNVPAAIGNGRARGPVFTDAFASNGGERVFAASRVRGAMGWL